MTRKQRYILVSLIVIVEILFYSYLFYRRAVDEKAYLKTVGHDFSVKVESVLRTFNIASELIYDQMVNSPYVMDQFGKVHRTDDSLVHAQVRSFMLHHFQSAYSKLRSIGIRQFHFHTPDNHSFLRFHRPQKFGDDLTDVRYSIKMANRHLERYDGFEEGRIFNGFRHVFPIVYRGEHLGSVETSFSFDAIRSELKKHGVQHTSFLISKDVVDEKVFSDETGNYVSSLISDGYVNEKRFLHYNDTLQFTRQLDMLLHGEVDTHIEPGNNATLVAKFDGVFYAVSFVNVNNVEGLPVAYFVSYQKDTYIEQNRQRFLLAVILGGMFIAIVLVLFFLFVANSYKIRKVNTELLQRREELSAINDKLQLQTLELEASNMQLNELNETKNKFFSIIAHDLKNPFSSITGLSQLVLDQAKKAGCTAVEEFIILINQTSRHGYSLLENLLQWSRIQTGHIKFMPQLVNLRGVVNDVSFLHDASRKKKAIGMTINVSESIEVYADMFMIDTVLRNLVSNALKYTEHGGHISLDAKAEKKSVKISVKDTGVGISQEDIGKIFSIHTSHSTLGTNDESGTGLGLVLCQEFVALHGSVLSVSSVVGEGTCFSFVLQTEAPKA